MDNALTILVDFHANVPEDTRANGVTLKLVSGFCNCDFVIYFFRVVFVLCGGTGEGLLYPIWTKSVGNTLALWGWWFRFRAMFGMPICAIVQSSLI